MPIAALLLREDSSNSLKALVERAQQRKTPCSDYDLQVNKNQLDLTPKASNKTSFDEGFESDIDSVSIVSSDDSFTLTQTQNESKLTETDSANGSSSSSDSDTDCCKSQENDPKDKDAVAATDSSVTVKSDRKTKGEDVNKREVFNLVDCMCYTDVKFPNILVFVIKKEALVFRFDDVNVLQGFFSTFTTLKALANQKTYNKSLNSGKFNLLHRTDRNGITHIEIQRQAFDNDEDNQGPSSIISINTPEDNLDKLINEKDIPIDIYKDCKYKESKIKTANQRQRSDQGKERSASSDNLLDFDDDKEQQVLQPLNFKLGKTWNSADNLLDTPKRPERKRRVKGKAPPPPTTPSPPTPPPQHKMEEDIFDNKHQHQHNVLSGQFVRVNVTFDPVKEYQKQLIIKSHLKEPHPKKLQGFSLLSTSTRPNFLTNKPKVHSYEQFKSFETKRYVESSTLQRIRYKNDANSWTNSVPRMLKKQRSKSETRNFTPMAYRYIDTTGDNSHFYGTLSGSGKMSSPIFGSVSRSFGSTNHRETISNRLFGLSPKLKEFNQDDLKSNKWGSMNELCFKNDSNLKSVIKKEDNKKKNEKKVTFSAYTTVQVV